MTVVGDFSPRGGIKTGRSPARLCTRSALSMDEPVRLPIEDALDLHAFPPRDMKSVVDEYVTPRTRQACARSAWSTAAARGVQRGIVQAALERHPLVLEFRDAADSHLGATIATLAEP